MVLKMYVFVGYDKGNKGVVLVDINTLKSVGVSSEQFKVVLGKGEIINIGVKEGKLVGLNGSLANYGVVGENNIPVIVKVGTKHNSRRGRDEAFEYVVSSTDGKLVKYEKPKALALFKKLGVANGKLVDKGDSSYVSAIRGSYPSYKLDEPKVTKPKIEVKKVEATKPRPKKEVKSYTKEEVADMLLDALDRLIGVRVDKEGKWFKYKNYYYDVRVELESNKITYLNLQSDYDIDKYATAPFINTAYDYDGSYKVIDMRHPAYSSRLRVYQRDNIRVKQSNGYNIKEECDFTLEEKDSLVYNHFIRLEFKKPVAITKENIDKIVSNFM